jgi:spermidine synthase
MHEDPTEVAKNEYWLRRAFVQTSQGDQIVLRQRGAVFDIRFNGWELMSSQTSASERRLATLVCDQIDCAAPRILIGGLGMGYTLRATLDAVGQGARITVCELFEEIVAWNQGPLAPLAAYPLDDNRVTLLTKSVLDVILSHEQSFDAIILDTDNGPDAIMHSPNRILYKRETLQQICRRLGSQGVVGLWSATVSLGFESVLEDIGWHWRRICVPLGQTDESQSHIVYLAGKTLRPENCDNLNI